MYNFTENAKRRLLEGKVTRAYIKVLATDTLPEIIINEENYLKDITFDEIRYIDGEGFIGQAVAKEVKGNFVNVSEDFSIQDREFELYFGVDVSDEPELEPEPEPEPEEINLIDLRNNSFPRTENGLTLSYDSNNNILNINGTSEEWGAGFQLSMPTMLNGQYTFSYESDKDISNKEFWISLDEQRETLLDANNNAINFNVSNKNYEKLIFWFNPGFTYDNVKLKLKLINKDIISKFSIDDNNSENISQKTEYVKYGTFIVQSPEDANQVNDNTYFEALDYMIKFNSKYENRINYPCTILDLFKDIVNQAGLTTSMTEFRNSNFILDSNPFDEQTTLRQALKSIAQIAFSWVRVDENNDVLMDFNINNQISDTIDYDKYYELVKNNDYGPLNNITLKTSNDIDVPISIKDIESIDINGETSLIITDNPIANTTRKRIELIEVAKELFGLSYTPVSLKTIGLIYLNCLDLVEVKNMSDRSFVTPIFNHTITFDGVMNDEIESKAETTTNSTYEFTSDIETALKQFKNQISLVADYSKEISSTDQLVLNDTMDGYGYIINLNIKGDTEKFDYLTPDDTLVPDDGLVPYGPPITIICDKQDRDNGISEDAQIFTINITEPLRNYMNIYDELNIKDGKIIVTRRIGENSEGNLYILDQEIIEELGEIYLKTFDEKTYVYIDDYRDLSYYCKYIIKNDFTDVFSPTVQVESLIEQTADKINLEVSKKVGENEIINAINLSPEEIKISGDKIDISGQAVHFQTDIHEEIGPFTEEDSIKLVRYMNGDIELTDEEIEKYDLNGDGTLSSNDLFRLRQAISKGGYYEINASFEINPYSGKRSIILRDSKGEIVTSLGYRGIKTEEFNCSMIKSNSITTSNLIVNNTEDTEESYSTYFSGILHSGKLIIAPEIKNLHGRIPGIEHGTISITPSAANTPTGKAIKFSSIFNGNPNITATPNTSAPGTVVTGVGVSGVSNSGATIYVTRTNTTSTGVFWIAMY